MKKTSVLMIAAALILSSCGIITQQASSDEGHRYQDGVYSSSPSLRSKAEKDSSQKETDELINRTKTSQIYLFGDRKDTVAIPENFSARIQYDQKVGGTVVTVGENPYDWRWDLENNYGYYYGPYSLGSSWYWSRHYSPFYSSWGYSPYWNRWGFSYWSGNRYFDPWYYNPYYYGSSWYFGGGWYDPWYYGGHYGWYDPWYYGGYYGWYNPWPLHMHHGWYDPHHHHHGPGHITISPESGRNRHYGLRARTEGSINRSVTPSRSQGSSSVSRSIGTVRRGIGISSNTSRSATASRGSSSRSSSAPVYKRPATTESTPKSSSYNSSTERNNSGSGYYRRINETGSSYERSSSSSFSRGGSSTGYSRSSSGFSGGSSSGGSYSRSSSGGHRR